MIDLSKYQIVHELVRDRFVIDREQAFELVKAVLEKTGHFGCFQDAIVLLTSVDDSPRAHELFDAFSCEALGVKSKDEIPPSPELPEPVVDRRIGRSNVTPFKRRQEDKNKEV